MTTKVRDEGPFEKMLTVQVAAGDLAQAKSRAARRLSRELKLKGFRPGKAPLPVVEAAVGAARLRSEAIEELLPGVVTEALRETELIPAVPPAVEEVRDAGDGVELDVKVTLWPEPTELPSYQGREITITAPEVDDEDVARQLDRLREQFAELEPVPRAAGEGDYVSINLSATHGSTPIEEVAASDLLYEVGARSYIDGLDEQLVGKAAGEIVRFAAPLPAGFGDRGGETVMFQALVKEVQRKKLPELSDEWASEVTEFATVAELREQLGSQLAEFKRGAAIAEFRTKLLDALLDDLELVVPDAIVAGEMDGILHRIVHELDQQGMGLADYLQASGIDQEVFIDDLRRQGDRNARVTILLDAVARAEGIEVTDEELTDTVSAIAANSEDPDGFRRRLAGSSQEKILQGDILRSKAFDALMRAAIPVDDNGSPVDLRIADNGNDEAAEVKDDD